MSYRLKKIQHREPIENVIEHYYNELIELNNLLED